MSDPKVKRALISTYDKSGLVELARVLCENDVEILSTGGTARHLQENDIPVKNVSDITGFPEILDGRVKTLHPKIYGGLLAKRTSAEHIQELADQNIAPIDMVVVNLYPFEKIVANPNVTMDEALENIDIGGPCMIRAAAKNYPAVAVVTGPDQYKMVIAELKSNNGAVTEETRKQLALDAFRRTAQYDRAISSFLSQKEKQQTGFGDEVTFQLKKVQDLRYGENPHQQAAFYAEPLKPPGGVVAAKQLHGKALSYNNIMDMNAAIGMVLEFDTPTVAIIKHSNPCGTATNKNLALAYENALKTDSVSAFGGIVAMNRTVSGSVAERIAKIFTEVVIAPAFSQDALDILTRKKNIRLIEWPTDQPLQEGLEIKAVAGGFLLQDLDVGFENPDEFKVVTKRPPTDLERQAMLFGWKLCKWVKSNAVIYVNEKQTLGIGAGQMSRVDASKFAVAKAKDASLSLKGSVVISDAFFPFRDGVDAAAQAGATAVIEPGGSVRDEEVIQAADERDMAMVFTGRRHFRH